MAVLLCAPQHDFFVAFVVLNLGEGRGLTFTLLWSFYLLMFLPLVPVNIHPLQRLRIVKYILNLCRILAFPPKLCAALVASTNIPILPTKVHTLLFEERHCWRMYPTANCS